MQLQIRVISRFRVRAGACERAALGADPLTRPGMTVSGSLVSPAHTTPKKKKDQLSLAQCGVSFAANRPDPDDPGGLGAEESGAERTGPTQ